MRLSFAVLAVLAGLPGTPGFPSREEALDSIYPKGTVKVQSHWLSKEEIRKASKLAGEPVGGVVREYRTTDGKGKLVGTAYVDVHKVRTKRQALLIAVSPAGILDGITVLGFAEPRDYLPRAKWFARFQGHRLNDQLRLRKGIDGVSGATLTSRATVSAARRALAVQAVLAAPPSPPPTP